VPGSIPGPATRTTSRVGQCPMEFHMLRPPGATPGPATTEYANRKSGHVEGVAILWVRLPPRSIVLSVEVQH